MADEKPSLHIDLDWKKQAQEEKKRLEEEEKKRAEAPKVPAPVAAVASTPDPLALTEHLERINARDKPDYILIDIAGSYERAITVAMARAHLTIG